MISWVYSFMGNQVLNSDLVFGPGAGQSQARV
jgi:hypothetical protein